MYAIVWSKTTRVGVVAAVMEGKRLAMKVLTVLPSVCTHCWHPFSSLLQNCRRARKLKQDLQISGDLCNYVMLKGQWSFEAQCSLPCLKTLTAASAYQADQSIIVC